MRIGLGIILAALMATGAAHAETPDKSAASQGAQQLIIPHIVGRYVAGTSVTRTKDSVSIAVTSTYQWPGTYIEAAFMGDEISIHLNDSANILRILIDGKPHTTLNKPGKTIETLKSLGAGQHVIRIERLTETQDATGTFEGLFAPKGAMLAVQPRARQIEFIGDSYTAGYGNTSAKRECTQDEIWATTDTQQAFGPLTAKHYNADYQINAYSGIGIVRNYNGVAPKRNMPLLYRSALIEDETVHAYADPEWNPAIVVIALGGNDFSTPVHSGEKWTSEDALTADYIASYVAFVQQVRSSHSGARFILMDYGEARVGTAITEVIKRLNAAGETRVASLDVGSGFALTGCDWHLNTTDDKRISASLIAYIDAHPGLWPNPENAK